MLVTQTQIGSSVNVPSSGYVSRLLLLDAEAVTMIATSPTGLVCTKVEVEEESQLYEIKLRPKSCLYSESNFEDENGNGYQVGFQLGEKDHNGELYEFLYTHQNRRWVALFETISGERLICGEVRNGLQLGFSKGGGTIGVSLKGKQSRPALRVSTLDPDVLFLQSEFIPADFSENDFLI